MILDGQTFVNNVYFSLINSRHFFLECIGKTLIIIFKSTYINILYKFHLFTYSFTFNILNLDNYITFFVLMSFINLFTLFIPLSVSFSVEINFMNWISCKSISRQNIVNWLKDLYKCHVFLLVFPDANSLPWFYWRHQFVKNAYNGVLKVFFFFFLLSVNTSRDWGNICFSEFTKCVSFLEYFHGNCTALGRKGKENGENTR